MVKSLSTMQETWVRSLGWEDPLEKEMAPHSSTISWKIPWTEEPGRLRGPWGRKELDTTERLHFLSFFLYKPDGKSEALRVKGLDRQSGLESGAVESKPELVTAPMLPSIPLSSAAPNPREVLGRF